MVAGQVGYHRPGNVRRVENVEKNNSIVRQIEKTKREVSSENWQQLQIQHQQELIQKRKAERREEEKKKKEEERKKKQEEYDNSYDRVFEKGQGTTSNADMEATEDTTAAEAFEDDFF